MAVINQGLNKWRRLVGCLLLTSSLAGARPARDDDRRRLRANRKNGNGGRALAKNKLMPQREVVRYSVDPRTVTPRAKRGAPPSEWDHDIDYHQKGLCGGAKCFFLSVSNPAEGYLLVHGDSPAPGGWSGLDYAVKAYEYAVDLETRYGIRHFYAATPYEVPTPDYFRQHLVGDYQNFFGGAETMIVQPEHTAPSGSIIVRCFNDRMLFSRLEYILQSMTLPMKENLLKELQDTVALVRAEPGLITDFQLLIDAEGRVYHLDFERAFHRSTGADKHSFQGCLEGAVEFLRMSTMSHATSFVLEGGEVKLVRAPQDEGVGSQMRGH